MRTLFAELKHFCYKNFLLKFFLFIFLFPVLKLQAQVTFGAPGSHERHAAIKGWNGFEFRKSWKYHEGDNKQWRSVNWDDKDWQEIKPDSGHPLSISNMPGFKGIGWFRMYFETDSSMMNVPLLMSLSQYGAMEVYVDGKFLHSFGLVGKEKAFEKAQFVTDVLLPFAFTLLPQKQHVIAVRYSNFTAAELNRQREAPFVQFEINIEKVNDLVYELPLVIDKIFSVTSLAAILLTLGLVHFILFLFYREKKHNLYYSIYSLVLSLLFIALTLLFTSRNFEIARFCTAFMVYTLPLIPIALIALLYDIFYKRMLKFFWVLLVISAAYVIVHFYRSESDKIIGAIIFFVSVAEIYRIIIKAIAKKKEGAAIFGIGF
ncbi:MAG TPA: hypothetical protein VJY62_21995, partial [Bacteroidia bacterium]|nr:hypothetical protein [Bacteroidia bacterium]